MRRVMCTAPLTTKPPDHKKDRLFGPVSGLNHAARAANTTMWPLGSRTPISRIP
jgi:hypothetical protein